MYRYELSLENEKQDVGLLMGISELDNVDDEYLDYLMKNFDENLPIPSFYLECKNKGELKRTRAFFTENGNSFFKKDIENLISIFKEKSFFDIDFLTLDETKETLNIVYQDDFQCLVLF